MCGWAHDIVSTTMLLNWRSLICEVKKDDRVISENLGETIQIDKTREYHSNKDGNNECLYSQSTKEMGYEARCIWPCWEDTANTLLWINNLRRGQWPKEKQTQMKEI